MLAKYLNWSNDFARNYWIIWVKVHKAFSKVKNPNHVFRIIANTHIQISTDKAHSDTPFKNSFGNKNKVVSILWFCSWERLYSWQISEKCTGCLNVFISPGKEGIKNKSSVSQPFKFELHANNKNETVCGKIGGGISAGSILSYA